MLRTCLLSNFHLKFVSETDWKILEHCYETNLTCLVYVLRSKSALRTALERIMRIRAALSPEGCPGGCPSNSPVKRTRVSLVSSSIKLFQFISTFYVNLICKTSQQTNLQLHLQMLRPFLLPHHHKTYNKTNYWYWWYIFKKWFLILDLVL